MAFIVTADGGYASGDMRVRVLFFGVLTEAFGRRELAVELPAGATVAGLVSVLREGSSKNSSESKISDELWGKIAVAVNREYARRDAVLREGDEVALLPPVSGGCCAANPLKTNTGVSPLRLRCASTPVEMTSFCGRTALLREARAKSAVRGVGR